MGQKIQTNKKINDIKNQKQRRKTSTKERKERMKKHTQHNNSTKRNREINTAGTFTILKEEERNKNLKAVLNTLKKIFVL